jgi:CheY-like chemotaxis protein/two-component sensor histidine kinase
MSEKDFHLDSPFTSQLGESSERQSRSAEPAFRPLDLRQGEMLSSLAHKIGHEIGNPLTSIISLATIVERFSNPKDPAQTLSLDKIAKYANSVVSEAWRISALNERMVLLLSAKEGHANEVDLAKLIQSALKKISTRKQLDCSDVILRFADGAPQTVLMDNDHLLLVIEELIGNALQAVLYSAEDTGDSDEFLPPVVVDISACDLGARVQITNSINQPFAGELVEVFDPFVTRNANHKHIGIGLPMVVGILEKSGLNGSPGATIKVEEVNTKNGLTFVTTLDLPTTASRSLDESEQIVKQSAEEGQSNFRLLVVDDETVVSSAIKKILEVTLSSETRTISCDCLSGSEAISAIDEGQDFDVLLCDLNLSDMSGRHVFEHLRQKRPADISKFAFITGDRSRPETQLFLSSVNRPFLHKPFEPEQLLALVAAIAPELKTSSNDK